jgi:hypothetical protein
VKDEGDEKQEGEQEPNGQAAIAEKLKEVQGMHKAMIGVIDRLQGRCIYCELIKGGRTGESISQGLGS